MIRREDPVSGPSPGSETESAPLGLRLWDRVGACLLLLYPPRFRREHGAAVRQTLREIWRRAHRRRGTRGLWIRALGDLADLAASGIAERFAGAPGPADRPRPTRRRSPRARTIMEDLFADLRTGLHAWAERPTFAAAAVLMLALGIAGNTAIFSVVNGLFLKPFPVPEPDRLVDLDETAPRWNLEYVAIAYPDFVAWREHNETFESMTAFDVESVNLSLGEEAERARGALVTHDAAEVLKIEPVLGRDFTEEDDRPGAPGVALLSRGMWEERFSADPQVLGRELRINGESYTLVGVLPSEAAFLREADVWVPLRDDPDEGGSYFLAGIGRLKEGVSIEQARQDLLRIQRGQLEEGEEELVVSPRVSDFRDRYLGDERPVAYALLGAVGIVLLIACGNVASLMLARASARTREIGVRMALGAGTGRIVRQLLTEGLLLAALGGGLGLVLGLPATGALRGMLPGDFPSWISFSVDLRVLLFCLLVTAGTVIVFGLVPAVRAGRTDLQAVLQSSGGRSVGDSGGRTLQGLVIAEVALAAVLLVAGGLLYRAYEGVQTVDPGFRTEGVLTFRLSMPEADYPERSEVVSFTERLVERLGGLPGVVETGAVTHAPLGAHSGTFFEAKGAPRKEEGEVDPVVLYRRVAGDYFPAMGVSFVAGLPFQEVDGRDEEKPAAIVNETFARTFWPRVEDPRDVVGREFRSRGSDGPWMSVVGVTRDVKHYGMDREMRPGIYLPHRQSGGSTMTFVIHARTDVHELVGPARAVVREMDPALPLFQVQTMEEALHESLWLQRAASGLFAVFAAVALVLALGGIYGVLSYAVTRRDREIGIRMALGARQRQVLRLVVRQGLTLVAVGGALGLVAGYGVGRLMSSLLHGVSPSDPLTYAGVAGLLLAVAAVANLLPAVRAARIDPMAVLRRE